MRDFVDIMLLGYAVIVAVVDTRRHRIPNALTVSAALIGLILGTMAHGADGLLAAILGLLVGFFLFLPLYLLGGFGAGDVKALAAAGSFLGPQGALLAAGSTLIIGGVGATLMLLAVGGFPALISMLRRWTFGAYVLCSTGRSAALRTDPDDAARRRFPYGIAIAGGIAASLLWG
jgi:prepilin peptidase CpaA